VDLQRRLDERGISVSWPDLMGNLARVHSVLVELEGPVINSGLPCKERASMRSTLPACGRPPPSLPCLPNPDPPKIQKLLNVVPRNARGYCILFISLTLFFRTVEDEPDFPPEASRPPHMLRI
jgi:hypothetical protein